MITKDNMYKILNLGLEKAQRSVAKNLISVDINGCLTLPAVCWAGIDEGTFNPSVPEWIEEVAKRYTTKVLQKHYGMSASAATWAFYHVAELDLSCELAWDVERMPASPK